MRPEDASHALDKSRFRRPKVVRGSGRRHGDKEDILIVVTGSDGHSTGPEGYDELRSCATRK